MIRKEGNVLFNNTLNTFYLQLYGKGDETCCCHMGYSFRLTARVLLYAPSHRQDSTYHGLCYTSRGAQAGTRNTSMGPPWRIDPTTHHTISECSYHRATSRSYLWLVAGDRLVLAKKWDVMSCWIDPLWWTHWAISCSTQFTAFDITKAVIYCILSVWWCI